MKIPQQYAYPILILVVVLGVTIILSTTRKAPPTQPSPVTQTDEKKSNETQTPGVEGTNTSPKKPVAASPTATAPAPQATKLASFTWNSRNISFSYPAALTVQTVGNSRLFINASAQQPDGDITIFWTRIDYTIGVSLEKRLSEYSVLPRFTQSTQRFGSTTFTKVTFYETFGDRTVTLYLKELNNAIFEYRVGKGESALASTVLSTISLPKY